MSNNIDEIIEKIKKNNKEENQKLAEDLKSGLSESQNQALGKLLSNSGLMKKLLESDEAQDIMKKIGGDDSGHQ